MSFVLTRAYTFSLSLVYVCVKQMSAANNAGTQSNGNNDSSTGSHEGGGPAARSINDTSAPAAATATAATAPASKVPATGRSAGGGSLTTAADPVALARALFN